jgi:hypothetical protein
MVEISIADPVTILTLSFYRHVDAHVFLAQSNHPIEDAFPSRMCTAIAESDSIIFEKVH